jgi:hypothetical protein
MSAGNGAGNRLDRGLAALADWARSGPEEAMRLV